MPPPSIRPEILKLLERAVFEHRGGRLGAAHTLYRTVLKKDRKNVPALHLLGVLEAQQGNSGEALRRLDDALKINPQIVDVWADKGKVLTDLARYEDALHCYERAVALNPRHWMALHNKGCALLYLKRSSEALIAFERVVEFVQDFPPAFNNRGIALSNLHRHEEAIGEFRRALALDGYNPETWSNLGRSLAATGRSDESLAAYDRALAFQPDFAEAWLGRANVYAGLKRFEEAFAGYDKALAIKSDLTDAWFFRGHAYGDIKWHERALSDLDRALGLDANLDRAESSRLHQKMFLCEWSGFHEGVDRLLLSIKRGVAADPFVALSLFESRTIQKEVAQKHSDIHFRSEPASPTTSAGSGGRKIRIGYFSADFHDHATAYLMAELFEIHDRDRFELTAFSFGSKRTGGMRQRLTAAFDRFLEVGGQSDREIADAARNLEIEIAVDLKGFTRESRPAIFSMRAAPVQVSYLGYPGTMGAKFIDYIIADPVLIPEEHRRDYTEKIVYLPHSYQVNDSKREISSRTFQRPEVGLPPQGFVFCCFNSCYKLTPDVFDSWMTILRCVDGSVLWLLEENQIAVDNLKKEAASRGVDPSRLVFAPRMPLPDHLARHRAADLFLDTLPYNAHTTASDALWAGLPLLTCRGETFAGRVAASLLTAVGLPELITSNRKDYETMAVELACNGQRLSEIRRKLQQNRLTTALFDTPRFARHLEAAYIAIHERYRAGAPPDHIHIQ